MPDTKFEISLTGADPQKLQDPQYLRFLCQKEVEHFEQYVRTVDPQFRDGFAKFERLAIEGYLYQKVKGYIDAFHHQRSNPMEKPDGQETGV